MAFDAQNLKPRYINLIDRWPGPVQSNLSIPTGGVDSTTAGNDSTTLIYPAGTKIAFYTDATDVKGWTTIMYMGFAQGTDLATDVSGDISNGGWICAHSDSTAAWADGSVAPWYIVTNDATGSDMTTAMCPIAIPCFTLSCTTSGSTYVDPHYGWFWVGGVCPVNDVSRFTTTVAAGVVSGFWCSSAGVWKGKAIKVVAGVSICGAFTALDVSTGGLSDTTAVDASLASAFAFPNGIVYCGTAVSV